MVTGAIGTTTGGSISTLLATAPPSLLYINRGGGKFEDEALFRGAALDADGRALSGMGVAAGDYDGDAARSTSFARTFSDEALHALPQPRRGRLRRRRRSPPGVGPEHAPCRLGAPDFFDVDNDGRKDLLLVNGHVFPEAAGLESGIRYRQRSILYLNRAAAGASRTRQKQRFPALRKRTPPAAWPSGITTTTGGSKR